MALFRWADFWVVRSALLPIEYPLHPSEDEDAVTRLLDDAVVRRALETASPSLLEGLAEPGRRSEAARHALVRYVERMRGRATPFAVLAGYSLVVRDEREAEAGVRLAAQAEYRHIVRLDLDVVCAIVRAYGLAHRDGVRWVRKRDLVVFPSVVRVTKRGKDDSLSYEDIARTPALDTMLRKARSPCTLAELASDLPARFSVETKRRFVDQLVDREILVPEIFPPLMGDDERAPLLAIAEAHDLLNACAASHDTTLASSSSEYRSALAREIRKLVPDLEGSGMIHDLVKPVADAGLGIDAAELLELAELLARLGAPVARDPRLADFLEHFVERYEGREVRLVDALDEDAAWDFPPPKPVDRSEDERDPSARWRRLTARLGERARGPAREEVTLTDEDLALVRGEPLVRGSTALVCKLAVGPEGRLEAWEPRLIAAPGSLLFARATGIDKELRRRTRRWLSEASRFEGDATMVADIAYFVIGKTAAISQYPVLQPFELTLAAATESNGSIEVDDLLLSVRRGSFVFRHAPTGREVVFRRTNAVVHARQETTSLVRFLDALTGAADHGSSWRRPGGDDAPFLPRVRWRRHVLAAARWRLEEADLRPLREAKDAGAMMAAVAALQDRRRLPRRVLHEEGFDHWLHVDLECASSVAAWVDVATAPAFLRELFPVERSAVTGPEGHYVHEAVFPLLGVSSKPVPTATDVSQGPVRASELDRVLPGGPWLYLEITGNRHELLRLLVDLASSMLEPLRAAGSIDRWFYLPYAQPHPHVRLRVHGSPPTLLGEVLPRLRAALDEALADRTIDDVAIRTYDRETYRYGGSRGMDLTEHVWSASSVRAVERLAGLDGILDMELEDVVAELVGLHRWLLARTSLSVGDRRALAAKAFERYCRADKPLDVRRRGGDVYRSLRGRIGGAASAEDSASPDELGRVLREIDEETRAGTITRSFPDLVVDYLHTQTIRLTTTWNPHEDVEAVAYVVLEKVYASILARSVTS